MSYCSAGKTHTYLVNLLLLEQLTVFGSPFDRLFADIVLIP
jgi:hypothetical protein